MLANYQIFNACTDNPEGYDNYIAKNIHLKNICSHSSFRMMIIMIIMMMMITIIIIILMLIIIMIILL